jgi:hypothetical protein
MLLRDEHAIDVLVSKYGATFLSHVHVADVNRWIVLIIGSTPTSPTGPRTTDVPVKLV